MVVNVENTPQPSILGYRYIHDKRREYWAENDLDQSVQKMWFIDGDSVFVGDILNYSFPEFGTYLIGLKMTTVDGQCAADTSLSVIIKDRADVEFTLNKHVFCQGEMIQVVNTTVVHSTRDTTILYRLYIGEEDLIAPFPPSSLLNFSKQDTGTYVIRLVAHSGAWQREFVDTIRVFANPIIDFGGKIQTCRTEITLKPRDSGIAYLWCDGSENSTLTITENGRYWLTLSNSYGCTTTENVEVVLGTILSTGLPKDTVHCGVLMLSVNYPNAIYSWSTQENTRSIHICTSGIYFVTLTDSICETTDTVRVTILEKPYLNLGRDTTICSGDTIILSAIEQPNVRYQWHTSYGQHYIGATINSFSKGTYRLTATHQISGCVSKDSITVALKDAPMLNLGGVRLLCDTLVDFDLIRESGAASIVWTLPDGSQTHGYLFSSSQTGMHKVFVQYANGCAAVDSVEIRRGDTRLVADFLLASAIKLADSIHLVNLSQSANLHHHTSLHYLWEISNGFRSEEESPYTQFHREGEFTVSLTVYSADSFCPALKQKAIYVSFDGLKLPKGEMPVDEDGQQFDSLSKDYFVGFLDAKLYPNPNDGNFSVQINLSAKADLYALFVDSFGRILDRKFYRNQSEYTLEYRFSDLKTGVYFLRLWSGQNNLTLKIVVSK